MAGNMVLSSVESRTEDLNRLRYRLIGPMTAIPQIIRQEANQLSQEIFTTLLTLRKIYDEYGEVIRKRWKRKDSKQRSRILKNAWPDIPKVHRKDIKALTKYHHLMDFACPEINLVDLLNKTHVLLFLETRARNLPSRFAHADFQKNPLGRFIMQKFILPRHTMLLEGANPNNYGTVLDWNVRSIGQKLLKTGYGFEPCAGLLVMHIQNVQLGFLWSFCKEVLHDQELDSFYEPDHARRDREIFDLFNPSNLQTVAPPAPQQSLSELPSMASIAAAAPYRLPSDIDLDQLVAVVQERYEIVIVEVMTARGHPTYFRDLVEDASEHRLERIKDRNGMRHPECESNIIFDASAINIVMELYGDLNRWQILRDKLIKLAALKAKYIDEISPEKELPRDLLLAFLSTRKLLDLLVVVFRARLSAAFTASPLYRQHYVRKKIGEKKYLITQISNLDDPLISLLTQITQNSKGIIMEAKISMMMDVLEECIMEKENRAHITGYVHRILTDLSFTAQILFELDFFQPWATTMEELANSKNFTKYNDELWEDESASMDKLKVLKDFELNGKADIRNERFAYPEQKKRTKNVVETMIKAETDLGIVWRTVDDYFENQTGKSLEDTYHTEEMDKFQPASTKPWVEPTPNVNSPTSPRKTRSYSEFLSSSPEKVKTQPEKKKKQKTQGIADPGKSETLNPLPEVEEPEIDRYPVDSRAFEAFRSLFFNEGYGDQPEQLKWTGFVHAMKELGFSYQHGSGSQWKFFPPREWNMRGITFDEPHPGTTVPFHIARTWGRRLAARYDWSIDSFVQKE